MRDRITFAALLAATLAGCWLTTREVEEKIAGGEVVETADTGAPEER